MIDPGPVPGIVIRASFTQLSVYGTTGKLLLRVECRTKAVRTGWSRHGECPPGVYRLGTPRRTRAARFGDWFLPLYDTPGSQAFRRHKRAGIGLHGGGSGLRKPFAPRQGWVPTRGCLRLQNADLARLLRVIRGEWKRYPVVVVYQNPTPKR